MSQLVFGSILLMLYTMQSYLVYPIFRYFLMRVISLQCIPRRRWLNKVNARHACVNLVMVPLQPPSCFLGESYNLITLIVWCWYTVRLVSFLQVLKRTASSSRLWNRPQRRIQERCTYLTSLKLHSSIPIEELCVLKVRHSYSCLFQVCVFHIMAFVEAKPLALNIFLFAAYGLTTDW